MAESNEGWFGSWLNAAKNKSTEVLEFVKKDLGEFGQAVKTEATNVVSSTGSVIEKTFGLDEPESTANTVKRSISSFLGQVNEALNPSPDDDDAEAILISDGEIVPLTKLQRAIHDLQNNASTFLSDPDPSLQKRYECWLEILDDQLSEQKTHKHLSSSNVLTEQYTKLVPEHVTHELFWNRYLFKKALLEDDIAMQEAMERREMKEKEQTEADLKWEHEDFAHDVELTEEEQIRLLEQYEKETKEKVEKQKMTEEVGDEVVFEMSPEKVKLETKGSNESLTKGNKQDKKKPKSEATKNETDAPVSNNYSNSSTDDDWEKINDVEK